MIRLYGSCVQKENGGGFEGEVLCRSAGDYGRIFILAGSLGIGQFALYFQQTQNLMSGSHGMLDIYSSITMRNKYIEKYQQNRFRISHSEIVGQGQ